MAIMAPVSAGELIDKLTILRVKVERIDAQKRANVRHELGLLEDLATREIPRTDELERLTAELTMINVALWDVEDGKRDCERRGDFGARFIELARMVYVENDRRAAIKRAINVAVGSNIVEEKSYQPYARKVP